MNVIKFILFIILLIVDSVVMTRLSIFGVVLETNIILIFAVFLTNPLWKNIGYALLFGLVRGILSSAFPLIEVLTLFLLLLVLELLKYVSLADVKSIRFSSLILGLVYPLIELVARALFVFSAPSIWLVLKAMLILTVFYYIMIPIFVKPPKESLFSYA